MDVKAECDNSAASTNCGNRRDISYPLSVENVNGQCPW